MKPDDWISHIDRHDHQRIPGWLWAGIGFALWTLAFGGMAWVFTK